MIGIDAHQHFWSYHPEQYAWISEAMPQLRRDFLPADLEPLLSPFELKGSIAVQARHSLEETDFLLDLSQAHPFMLGVVGWVDLQAPDLEKQLSAYSAQLKLCGFRHIVQDEPDEHFLLRPDFLRGMRLLHDYGFTYDILVYERQLPQVPHFLEQCPDQPFVLDHLGKPEIQAGISKRWRESIRAIASFPNVYCKISGLVTEADWAAWQPAQFMPFLEEVLDAFGPDRLMIGSDWPVCLLAATDYAQTMGAIAPFIEQLTMQDREKLFGGTAAHFYGITPA